MKFGLVPALLLSLGTVAVSGSADDGKGHRGRTIYVEPPPASISDAIKKASYGDRIIVGPETYQEQVLVKKSGIQLIGKGTIITPPPQEITNDCTGKAGFVPGLQAGICVAGEDVQTTEGLPEHQKVLSVGTRVEGVSITGFTVSGFSGANIFLLGAKNTRVFKNELEAGGTYGFLTSGSENTQVTDNVVVTPPDAQGGFVGICVDDFNKVEVARNKISGGNLVGVCISTSGALIRDNDVSNCCFQAFVDPGVDGAKVIGNKLHDSAPCGDVFGGVTGLSIDGATNTEVRGNNITGIRNPGSIHVAGVAVVDDECGPDSTTLACIILGRKAVASNNLVTGNFFDQNDVDIAVNTTGTGNVAKKNKCSTFQPTDLQPNPCRRG